MLRDDPERPPRVLLPGAGLARLCCEVAALGYEAQGNEFRCVCGGGGGGVGVRGALCAVMPCRAAPSPPPPPGPRLACTCASARVRLHPPLSQP